MADPTIDNKIDIEIAIKDSMSAALQTMARELIKTSRQAEETTKPGSGGFGNLSKLLEHMSGNLVGPLGVVGAFAAAGKAMADFATGRIQLERMASDMRLSTQDAGKMGAAFERLGAGKQALQNFAGALRDIDIKKWGSETLQAIQAMPSGGQELAKKLFDEKDIRKRMEIITKVMTDPRTTDEARTYIANVFHVPESAFLQFDETMRKISRKFEVTPEMKQYEDDWNQFWDDWADTVDTAGAKMFGFYSKWRENWLRSYDLDKLNAERKEKGLAPLPPREFMNVPTEGPVAEEREKLRKQKEEEANRLRQTEPFKFNDLFRRQSYEEGGSPSAAPIAVDTLRDISQTEESSNVLLRDVRDTLARMETGATEGATKTSLGGGTGGVGGGTGGGGTGGGGTGGGAAVGGAAGPMGGGGGAAVGRGTADDGVSMGGGGAAGGRPTRADRNNNPGNIKFGAFAKSMGATHADEQGHAVFPDRETGFKAAEALLGGKAYSGLTLRQIGSKWAAGDPGWAQNVSRATGIPLDAVPTPDQHAAIARRGIPLAEGTSLGGGMPTEMFGKGGEYQLKGEGPDRVATGGGGGAPGEAAAGATQGDTPYRMRGNIDVGGQQFPFGSGGAGRGAIPYGSYPIQRQAPGPYGQRVGGLGINQNLIQDPRYGRPREGIIFHPGMSDQAITQGCISIAGSRWREFKSSVVAMMDKEGRAYVHVGPNGASVTSSPTPPWASGGEAGAQQGWMSRSGSAEVLSRPSAAEKNWTDLNEALKQRQGLGTPEGSTEPGKMYGKLKGLEEEMEMPYKMPEGKHPSERETGGFPSRPRNIRYDAFQNRVDREMSGNTAKWEGAASIEVDFKGMPNGVRGSVDQEGFKTLKVSKSRQGDMTDDSARANSWAYE